MKKVLFLLCIVALASCNKSKESTVETPSASFEDARQLFFNNLVAPAEAAARLQATAAEFNGGLLNSPAVANGYLTDEVKAAANLGVYLADLNYSVAYKQEAHIKEIFPAATSLAKAVGIEQTTLDFLSKRFSDNLAQNDSVKAVVDALFAKSTKDLQGTEREKLVGIAMAAYQIENLYLAIGIIESYPKDMLPEDARVQILIPVYRMALEQKENINIIHGFLKTIADPSSPNYEYYSTAFAELIDVYNRLNVDEMIASNKGLALMNDAVIHELHQKVNAIRSKIISQ